MRSLSGTWPTVCVAATRLRRNGRATSARSPAPNGSSCSSILRAAASTSASRTASLVRARALPSGISRLARAWFPTASRPARCWTGCAIRELTMAGDGPAGELTIGRVNPTLRASRPEVPGRRREGARMKLKKPMRIVLAAFLGIAGGAGLVGGAMLTSLPAAAQFWGGWGGGGGGGGWGVGGGGGGDPFRPRPRRDIPQQQPQSQNPFGGFFQAPPWQHQQPAVRAPRPTRTQLGDFS